METMTTKELETKRDQAHAAFEKASRESGYRADLDQAKAYWHRRWVEAVTAEKASLAAYLKAEEQAEYYAAQDCLPDAEAC